MQDVQPFRYTSLLLTVPLRYRGIYCQRVPKRILVMGPLVQAEAVGLIRKSTCIMPVQGSVPVWPLGIGISLNYPVYSIAMDLASGLELVQSLVQGF